MVFDWLIERIHYWSWSKLNDEEMREKNTRYCQEKWPLWHHRLVNYGARDARKLGIVIGDATLERFKGYRFLESLQTSSDSTPTMIKEEEK